jgi:hypothetical protein
LISLGLKHYPQNRFQQDQKYLWNPIQKKGYKHRPEERIRLQFIEYLIHEAGFSKHRIALESPVTLPRDKASSRTDVLCFDDNFKPLLLVECKAAKVQLDEKTSIQIARYNTEIGAPFLMVTNGQRDFWFMMETDQINLLQEPPALFTSKKTIERNFEYWQHRGFVGTIEEPVIKQWIVENCQQLYVESSSPAHYFDFDGTEQDLQLPNYYQILLINEQTQLAVSLTATSFGATKMNVILNKDGENRALLSASIDTLASDEVENTMIQNANGITMVDLVEEVGFDFLKSITHIAQPVCELMLR